MKRKLRHATLLPALAMIASAGSLFAETRPDFTGVWKLNVAKSDFGGGSSMQEVKANVKKCDTVLKYFVSGVDPGGNPFDDSVDVPIDGKPHDMQDGQGQMSIQWDGPALKGQTKSADEKMVQNFRISLEADGKTLIRDVQMITPEGESHRKEIYEKQ
jgi:hypothetical protein